MFTGIIEYVGKVQHIVGTTQKRLCIETQEHIPYLKQGESIALDGICLTVESYTDTTYTCYASAHTVNTTTLRCLRVGSYVNLERALLPTSRLGGHFVSGHVDTTLSLVEKKQQEDTLLIACSFPDYLRRYIVEKGSIALQGISLTISAIENNILWVTVIPETQKNTTIPYWKKGQLLNVEVDILAKYVEKLFHKQQSPITIGFLQEHGFWR